MQVIYIDILLLINFSMDFVALFLTARLMHARAKAIPLAVASLIGAGYEALRLFISWPLSVISDIACAVLMCVIALGASELLRTTLTFLCASIIIGGTMTALYSFAGMGDGLFSGSSAESTDALLELPFGRFIPAAALSAAFALLLCRTLRSRLGRRKCICRITVNGSSAERTLRQRKSAARPSLGQTVHSADSRFRRRASPAGALLGHTSRLYRAEKCTHGQHRCR